MTATETRSFFFFFEAHGVQGSVRPNHPSAPSIAMAILNGAETSSLHPSFNYGANLQGRRWYYIYPLLKGNSV